MTSRHDSGMRCFAAMITGAVAGGIIVAVATRALPRAMSEMMRNMMARMAESGCSPAEM